MPTNQKHINRNRTLLILLGIILAFLLTLNAKSFYTTDHILPSQKVNSLEAPESFNGEIHKTGQEILKVIAEKFTYLKK